MASEYGGIRFMQEKDLDQVAQMEQEIFSIPWSRDGFQSSLQSKDTIYMITYVRQGETDRVIAYCGLLRSFEEADITNVAVQEAFRGQGVARRMISALMEEGRKQGIERFTLEVRTGNKAAIHLYETLGFHGVGVRKRFYEKPTEDALIMWTSDVI